MSQKPQFLDCWMQVATSLLSQALVGEPVLSDALPRPLPEGSFGFAATVDGEEQGRFVILLDGGLAEGSLLGDVPDVRAAWAELIRETVEAAAGELLARSGVKCQVTAFGPADAESKITRAFQLSAGERSWVVLVASDLKAARPEAAKLDETSATTEQAEPTPARNAKAERPSEMPATDTSMLSEGLQLLLDVELEASLRFGSREMPLGEILDLGPGDVVQLDRHVSDPVDLVVGDKIVARGEVVLVNGNFGLRVTQVAEPQRRLESIRCLF